MRKNLLKVAKKGPENSALERCLVVFFCNMGQVCEAYAVVLLDNFLLVFFNLLNRG